MGEKETMREGIDFYLFHMLIIYAISLQGYGDGGMLHFGHDRKATSRTT
jgi:hypothetical protein